MEHNLARSIQINFGSSQLHRKPLRIVIVVIATSSGSRFISINHAKHRPLNASSPIKNKSTDTKIQDDTNSIEPPKTSNYAFRAQPSPTINIAR